MKAKRCRVCHEKIKVMTGWNTGVCSEICRKVHFGEISLKEGKKQRKAQRAHLEQVSKNAAKSDPTLTGTPNKPREVTPYNKV